MKSGVAEILIRGRKRKGRHLDGPLSWDVPGKENPRRRRKCDNIEPARLIFDKNQKRRNEARRVAAHIATHAAWCGDAIEIIWNDRFGSSGHRISVESCPL
jgi:hypothetical protein